MKPIISILSTFNKRNYFLVSLILLVITTNVDGARLVDATLSRSEIVINLSTSCHQQIIKSKSSHPLSLLNFNKTRPRGITPQEPMPKNLLLSNVIHIYPPYLSSFIDLTPFFDYSLMWANTIAIRPPPSH
jgi:hypothetical protein